ncbi:transporter substrate-binding domain-containing protein, partial [Rahnella perminowiae]
MKKLKIALLLGCAVASFSALADGSTLKFGLEAQYPPFESKSATGELQGFDIDLGNAVCAAARVKCDWYDTSFDGLIAALQARKFDAINSAMNVTEKRRQAIDFTQVIYRVPTKLIAKKDSGLLPTTESLKGKHIGVLQGSIQESYAQAHWAPKG